MGDVHASSCLLPLSDQNQRERFYYILTCRHETHTHTHTRPAVVIEDPITIIFLFKKAVYINLQSVKTSGPHLSLTTLCENLL